MNLRAEAQRVSPQPLHRSPEGRATHAFIDSIGEGGRKSIGDVIASISEDSVEIDVAEENTVRPLLEAQERLPSRRKSTVSSEERLAGFDEELVTCNICCAEEPLRAAPQACAPSASTSSARRFQRVDQEPGFPRLSHVQVEA